jgi:hypothetical protein
LVFVKSVAQRDAELDDVLDALNRKYASFNAVEDLKQSVKSAIEQAPVMEIRSLSSNHSVVMRRGQAFRELHSQTQDSLLRQRSGSYLLAECDPRGCTPSPGNSYPAARRSREWWQHWDD